MWVFGELASESVIENIGSRSLGQLGERGHLRVQIPYASMAWSLPFIL